MLDINKVIKVFHKKALGGQKVSQSISNPVFRRGENGDVVIAGFVYLYSVDDIRAKKVKRPSKWVTIDIISEEFKEYDCCEKDFCDISFDTYCDLTTESETEFSDEYTNTVAAIFDLVVKKYTETGEFDTELNNVYMYMVLNMVSVGFKDFYKALSNI